MYLQPEKKNFFVWFNTQEQGIPKPTQMNTNKKQKTQQKQPSSDEIVLLKIQSI